MPDREYRVGEVIENTNDLTLLGVGTVICGTDASVPEEMWTRVVNGYLCTNGHAGVDAGKFVPNEDVPSYFEPGYNEIFSLPETIQATIVPASVFDEIRVVKNLEMDSDEPVITKSMIDEQNRCACGDCECGKEDGADVETIKPEEFVPKFPNDPDDPNRVTPRADVLREAEFLITGDRNKTYGPPTQNFRTIAGLLNERFADQLKRPFTGSDVADMMILVKVARNAVDPKRDSWTDIAGYAACGYECTLDEN
jgi:hypothetical protein